MSSELTPNLGLPYLAAAQSQKHVTHNEAIRALDALVQLSVRTRALASPPATPLDGQRWIVAASASGAWSGHDGTVAAFQDGAWSFLSPRDGWLVWIADEGKLIAWNGAHWIDAAGAASINPAPLVGVNATADSTNRLAVKSDASLFDNTGHGHQIKLNKATASDTASVLFQEAYAGRAEIGLCGDDNFHFKVSADGSAWKEAIQIDRTTGAVSLPFTTLASSYTLPTATASALGGVKQGTNVAIAADGSLTVPPSAFDANGAATAAQAFATQRSNHTGTQAASSITGLAAVATSGNFADLSGKPTLGTAAALNVGTAANSVVQLTAAGKLPAIDGSQLTNLPSGSGTASFTAPGPTTVPLTITAATGQTARMLEFITPGVPPYPGARSYFGQWGQFETQAWMTISGVFVDDGSGGIKQVVYAGSSPAAPTDYTSNRITGGGNMLGVSNDIVGPAIAVQDNLNQYLGGGAQVAIRAAVAAGGTGFVVGDGLTVSGGTSVPALPAVLDGVNQTVRGTGYTVGNVLTVVGGVGTAATIRVDTVNGTGGILTATLLTPGSYSVNPSNSTYTTGGSGTGAYFYFAWGTRGVAKLRVDAVSSGVITALSVVRPGLYTALPSNPVTLTGGTGTGATATLEWTTRATKSRYMDFLDYTRTLTNVWGGDGTLTFGNAQDIDLFWQSKANLYWIDNDTLGSDGTLKPAGLNTQGIGTLGNASFYKASRDVASGSDKTTAIGSFYLSDSVNPAGTGAFRIMVTTYAGAFSTAKIYDIPVSYNYTSNTWQQVAPVSGALQNGYPSNELALDFNVNQGTVSFRLRNTIATAVHAEVSIMSSNPRDRAAFTADTSVATGVTAPTITYTGKLPTAVDLVTKSFSVPVSSGTATIPQASRVHFVNPAGTLAILTVAMQSGQIDGQRQTITFKQAITQLYFSTPGGTTDWTGGNGVAINQRLDFVWDAATFKWWRIQ